MHAIHELHFSTKASKDEILSYCADIANDYGDYENQITKIRFNDIVLENQSKAEEWIRRKDSGWYDNLAVKYRDGEKIMWLVKIEYHC